MLIECSYVVISQVWLSPLRRHACLVAGRGGDLVPDMHVQSAGLVQCNNIVPAEKLVSNVKIA